MAKGVIIMKKTNIKITTAARYGIGTQLMAIALGTTAVLCAAGFFISSNAGIPKVKLKTASVVMKKSGRSTMLI